MDLTHLTWRTSSRSNSGGQCVEVGLTHSAVGVRDSKDRAGGMLVFDNATWTAFVATIKAGDEQHPSC